MEKDKRQRQVGFHAAINQLDKLRQALTTVMILIPATEALKRSREVVIEAIELIDAIVGKENEV
jgi:hypothetical protein